MKNRVPLGERHRKYSFPIEFFFFDACILKGSDQCETAVVDDHIDRRSLGMQTIDSLTIGDQRMSNCEKCKFRAKYDRNPRSILGRIWKWHIGWCPGWKAYLKSLPDETRQDLMKRYR